MRWNFEEWAKDNPKLAVVVYGMSLAFASFVLWLIFK